MQCHACKEKILAHAKVCRHCGSSQNETLYLAKNYAFVGTLVFSILSLAVSLSALFLSYVAARPMPRIVVQTEHYDEEGFSFYVANIGNLPTALTDIELTLTLRQGDGAHLLRLAFHPPRIELPSGASRLVSTNYAAFELNEGGWQRSGNVDEEFSLGFMDAAVALGTNLDCEIGVSFVSPKYSPTNVDRSTTSVNGMCAEAMRWFALNVALPATE